MRRAPEFRGTRPTGDRSYRMLLFSVLATVGSLAVQDPSSSQAPTLAKEDRAVLNGRLIDYPSARFRNVYLYRMNGTSIYCGEINAKNSMGGYTGWQFFSVGGPSGFTMGYPGKGCGNVEAVDVDQDEKLIDHSDDLKYREEH